MLARISTQPELAGRMAARTHALLMRALLLRPGFASATPPQPVTAEALTAALGKAVSDGLFTAAAVRAMDAEIMLALPALAVLDALAAQPSERDTHADLGLEMVQGDTTCRGLVTSLVALVNRQPRASRQSFLQTCRKELSAANEGADAQAVMAVVDLVRRLAGHIMTERRDAMTSNLQAAFRDVGISA